MYPVNNFIIPRELCKGAGQFCKSTRSNTVKMAGRSMVVGRNMNMCFRLRFKTSKNNYFAKRMNVIRKSESPKWS